MNRGRIRARLAGVIVTASLVLGTAISVSAYANTNGRVDGGSSSGIVLAAKDTTDYVFKSLTPDQRAAAIAGLLNQLGYNKNSTAAILAVFEGESSSLRSDRLSTDKDKCKKENAKFVVDNDFRIWVNGKKVHCDGMGIGGFTHVSWVEKLQNYADARNTPVIGLKVQTEFYASRLKNDYNLGPEKTNGLELDDIIYRIWTKVQRSKNAQKVKSLSEARSNSRFQKKVVKAQKYVGITPSNLLTSSSGYGGGPVTGGDSGSNEGAGESEVVEKTPCETSILPDEWCNAEDGGGIYEILNLIIAILTAGVGVGATVGIVVSAIQYLTARDSEEQVKKARTRLTQIVIGLLTYALMWAFLQWLLPGGLINTITRANSSMANPGNSDGDGDNNGSNNVAEDPGMPETGPIQPPDGAKIIRKASSPTMEVTIQETSNAKITRIWAKDPYNQLNKYSSSDYGKNKDTIPNMLNKALSAKGLKNKVAIGTNSDVSTAYGGYRCNTKLWKNYTCMTPIINNGKTIRENTTSTALREMSYGIAKNGELKLYFVDYPNDSSNEPEWAKAMHDEIKADGVRNTFMGKVGLIEDGKKLARNGYSDNAWKNSEQRILFCQVDRNNFIYVTKRGTDYESQDYMLSLGCKTAVSMDGGGSTTLYYKDAKKSGWEKIRPGSATRTYMWAISYWSEV